MMNSQRQYSVPTLLPPQSVTTTNFFVQSQGNEMMKPTGMDMPVKRNSLPQSHQTSHESARQPENYARENHDLMMMPSVSSHQNSSQKKSTTQHR